MIHELPHLLDTELVVRRADHPGLVGQLDWARARGDIVSVLPGVYAATPLAQDFRVRALAVCMADPDAVLLESAAARLHCWPDVGDPAVLCVASRRLHGRKWLRVSRRTVPPELLVSKGPLRFTGMPLTAHDLAVSTGGASIDESLRAGVTLDQLHEVFGLLGRRRGDAAVRRLLRDARDEPWSIAERRAHVILREVGIESWRANRAVLDAGKLVARIDLAFDDCLLAIEIDGDRWHLSPTRVLKDRLRDRRLAELGWTVVRFRALDIESDAEGFVESVRRLLAAHGGATRREPARGAKWVA